MAFGSLEGGDDNAPLAEINMVPLIDVMLVLLVIFIVTAPMLGHAVKVNLPKAEATPLVTPPKSVQLAIDAQGQVHWDGQPITPDALSARLAQAGQQQPAPELLIRAERTTPYENVARLMADASRNGLGKIGFVTDPNLR